MTEEIQFESLSELTKFALDRPGDRYDALEWMESKILEDRGLYERVAEKMMRKALNVEIQNQISCGRQRATSLVPTPMADTRVFKSEGERLCPDSVAGHQLLYWPMWDGSLLGNAKLPKVLHQEEILIGNRNGVIRSTDMIGFIRAGLEGKPDTEVKDAFSNDELTQILIRSGFPQAEGD